MSVARASAAITRLEAPDQACADSPAGDPFLICVGRRVRAVRERRRLSRRALADRCGLSQRFLADVERGRGNISILRLKALADALQLGLEDLVGKCACSASRPAPESAWRDPQAG